MPDLRTYGTRCGMSSTSNGKVKSAHIYRISGQCPWSECALGVAGMLLTVVESILAARAKCSTANTKRKTKAKRITTRHSAAYECDCIGHHTAIRLYDNHQTNRQYNINRVQINTHTHTASYRCRIVFRFIFAFRLWSNHLKRHIHAIWSVFDELPL